ncbi:unnamed protein product [Brassica napus]|uniref:(rape) hypothetical protein n=1 Tax=Brassica napus TaxID=3708 RepID=A0A816UI33_BRANA|nr:unnamed protein product [Brassica napus]
MSNNASLTPVKDLKPFKTKWRSQVKVLHSWLQNTGFGGETLQMVLTDEQGEKISATCKRNNILSVQRKLPLGKWRVLTTFSVSQASGQYRPTSHPYKITISDETVISNSDLIVLSLPRYEDIIDGTLKTNFLIDVMGKIVSLEPVQTVQVEGQDRKKVQFRLLDANGKDLACCLWGKYAEKMEACVEREQPLICLIRFAKISFAKISFYRGEVKITNAFDASIVYLDPTMEKALQFKEKFKLHLIVRDDTETCKLLLLNTVAKTIVGHEAVDLWDDSYDVIEDPELLPEQVRALEGKSFVLAFL